MATRGTIRFAVTTKEGEKTLGFVYVHHDMYQEGMASYLREIENVQGNNLMSRFVRGIKGAEITISHEWHGDTEFRFDIVDDEISTTKRYFDYEEEKTYFYKIRTQKLQEFIGENI